MTCYIPGRCVVRQEHGTGVSPVAWDRPRGRAEGITTTITPTTRRTVNRVTA